MDRSYICVNTLAIKATKQVGYATMPMIVGPKISMDMLSAVSVPLGSTSNPQISMTIS